jgi:predicted polyphosphate/ATP-dependent NAD kinase
MDVRLYGLVLVPDVPGRLQSLKAASAGSDEDDVVALAQEVARRLPEGALVILGPGTTTRTIGAVLQVPTTLLGFDVIEIGPDATGRVVVHDAAEPAILAAIEGRTAYAVLSPTGGQGFLLGRGNQQLSPAVLRAIGLDHLLVAATPAKLAAVAGRALHVDTGDPALDAELTGYRRVITGPALEAMIRVAAG